MDMSSWLLIFVIGSIVYGLWFYGTSSGGDHCSGSHLRDD